MIQHGLHQQPVNGSRYLAQHDLADQARHLARLDVAIRVHEASYPILADSPRLCERSDPQNETSRRVDRVEAGRILASPRRYGVLSKVTVPKYESIPHA